MLVYFLHKILLFLSYVEINFYQQNRLSIMFLDIIFMQNYESEVSAIKKNSIIFKKIFNWSVSIRIESKDIIMNLSYVMRIQDLI